MLSVPDVTNARSDLAGQDRRAQTADQLFLRQRSRLEEALHQLVVGFGHHLDERLAGGRRPRPLISAGTAPSVTCRTPSVVYR